MAHYAYKHACYDIDYEKYKQLVKQFEQEEGREHDGDSNYDGDNWYIMAMWINELRAKVAELENRASPASVPEGQKPVASVFADEDCTKFIAKNMSHLRPMAKWWDLYIVPQTAAPTPPVSEDRKDAPQEDYFADACRLALELECLLLDCKDTAVTAKWWDSAHEALEQHRERIDAMQEDKL